MGAKNDDIGEEEEDFDKESPCFKSLKENVTHDVVIGPHNLYLKASLQEMEEKNEKNREMIFQIANLVDLDELSMKFLKDDLKGVDIQPPLGVFQTTKAISMYTIKMEQLTFNYI